MASSSQSEDAPIAENAMRSKLVNTTTQTPLKWVRAMRGLGPYAVADPCRLINLHCVQAPLVVGGKRSGIGIAVSLDVAQKHLSHWEANASKVMSADEVLQVASVSLKHKFLASRHTDIAKNVRNQLRPDSKDNSAGSVTENPGVTHVSFVCDNKLTQTPTCHTSKSHDALETTRIPAMLVRLYSTSDIDDQFLKASEIFQSKRANAKFPGNELNKGDDRGSKKSVLKKSHVPDELVHHKICKRLRQRPFFVIHCVL